MDFVMIEDDRIFILDFGSLVTQMMMRKSFLLSITLFAFLFAFSARADVTIALVAPLTGSTANMGEQMRYGAEQAVEDINAKGGVLGQKIILKEFDDACDPKQAVTAANRTVSENIKFVVGHYCSGAALAAEPIYLENETLIVSPVVSHPKFTEDADTFAFRIGFRTNWQAAAIAGYILKHFRDKNVAILNDKGSYGEMVAKSVKELLNRDGKQEILYDSFNAGEKDYSAIVTLLKQKQAEVLVIGGYHTEVGLIARQLREQNLPEVVMTGSALMTHELWAITGKAGEGILFTFGPDPRKRIEAKAAVASLRKGGYEPEGHTMYTYAAVQTIAQGIAAAGNVHTRAVAGALRQGTFPTVVGNLRFDAKGDIEHPEIVMYKWHNGTYVQTD